MTLSILRREGREWVTWAQSEQAGAVGAGFVVSKGYDGPGSQGEM